MGLGGERGTPGTRLLAESAFEDRRDRMELLDIQHSLRFALDMCVGSQNHIARTGKQFLES